MVQKKSAWKLTKKVLIHFNTENLVITNDKSKFDCKQLELLGYAIDEYDNIPMLRKTEAI